MSDFKIKCVKVFGHAETQKLIDEAYTCLRDQSLSPVWFKEEECFAVNRKTKNEIYIFDMFTGDAFEHIASLGCRVLGPMCVVTCLACKQDIPRRQDPIYNLAMKDVVVCCTNIDREQRDLLHKKVEWMGGIVTKDFTDEVTHLVAGTVGSQKYQVAGSYSRQIMLPKWVDEVWEKSKLEAVHGNDEQFQEYKCPIFMGHVISVSRLNASERTEAKRLIENEGGTYSGEMKARECTHLIINEPIGQKYNFAIRWEVHVVRSEWLYESIEKGYCQDEAKYPVAEGTRGGMKTSTPERHSIAGDLSDINNISMISMANVNETAFSNVTNMTTRLEDPTENLDLTKTPEDMFLDGCKIYLSGFRGATLEKLRKIINSGGGTRFNQITDNLTHVVIGERIINDIDMIKSLTNRPHTVTSQWLVECFKQERLVEETTYHTVEVVQPMPKTPEVKGVRKKARREELNTTISKEADITKKDDDDMQDIMSQYLNNERSKHTDLDATRSNETTVDAGDVDDDPTQDPNSTTVNEGGGGVFIGRSFVFYGFTEDAIPVLSSYIKENGGTLLQSNARRIPDYAIVPIDGYPVDRTVKDIATNAWLQMCIEQNVLFDLNKNPLFTPIEINVANLPLDHCVLSISGYLGTERDCLVSIANVLGAKTQFYFVRNAKNDLLPSSHLIVNAPEGSKYQAAKKWGIPAVSKLWILACAKSGRKEQLDTFLIDSLSDDNVNISSLLEKQSTNKQLNQSEHLPADNQSTKRVQIDQSESSKSRKYDSLNENGANLNKTNESIAQNYANEPEHDLTTSNKEQEAVRSNETSLPDFSTMGDTEAILAGLNSQGEHDTACDKSRSRNIAADEIVSSENNDSTRTRVTAEETNIGAKKTYLPSRKQDISEEIDTVGSKNKGTRVSLENRTVCAESNMPSCTLNIAECNMPSCTRNIAESNMPSHTRNIAECNMPARTRNIAESNMPSRTRNIAECNMPSRSQVTSEDVNDVIAVDNEDGVSDVHGENNTNVPAINKNLLAARNDAKKPETPPLTRFMRKIEKDPPKFGSPYLTEMSAREKLMGKGFQGCRTIERKRNQKEQSQSQKENMETPKQSRVMELQGQDGSTSEVMRNLETDPPKCGTPHLTEMSARDKLMGIGFQSWRTIERKRKQEEQSQSQKENLETPKLNRVKELQGQDGSTIDKVTPSKFLNPNVRYFPKFNTEELLKSLETPEAERAELAARAKNRKESLGDDELVELAWSKATKKMAELREARLQGNFQASQSPHDEPGADFEEPSTALQGVVITVGKKLTKDQSELNDLVASLGGDYRWNYDSSCTHFIFQGRQNDTAKDFKHAKSQGMKIVSPHWLYMCEEQNCKVDENLFPHTFNPNLSLSVVSTRRTPLRTPRSSRRTARKADNPPPPSIGPIIIQGAENGDKAAARVNDEALKDAVDLKSPARSSSDDDPTRVTDAETCGSLEMREVLSKQLQDVMSKGKKRRKSKKLNCSGQLGTPEEPSTSRQTWRTQENVQKNTITKGSRSMADEHSEKNSNDIAPSQPVHVSWDDPMSRLEQAKLAHKLERANSPTQDVSGLYDLDPEDAQYSECDGEDEVPVPPFGEQQQIQEKTTPKHINSTAKKTPTPEGPSISFPTSNKSSEVTPPKPVVMEEQEQIVNKSPPIFIMSGMSMAERDNYGAMVEQLGGTVLDTQVYDNTCTHLIINKVTRNEKFLACLAAGKWVLHKSYLEACQQEQRFVEEDFYEWGSEGTLSLVKNMESNVRLLAVAARDWRLKIQEEKLKSMECYGAFCSWRVVLNCDKTKEANYGRLLVAGGATVLNLKPPYSGKVDATHALLELHKVPLQQEDMEVLVGSGCLCLKPDYISGFLCNPSVDVADYTPAEISALHTAMGEKTKKRKASSSGVAQKRSKRR